MKREIFKIKIIEEQLLKQEEKQQFLGIGVDIDMVKSLYDEFDDLISVVSDLGYEGEEIEKFIAYFLHIAIENLRGEINVRKNNTEGSKV